MEEDLFHIKTEKGNSPLINKRVLITRPQNQAEEFVHLLRSKGAETIIFPTIQIIPPQSWDKVDEAISKIEVYDMIIFTSVNGVKFFFQRFKDKGENFKRLKNIRICAIGPKTAAQVEKFHFQVSIIPKEFCAESIVAVLGKKGMEGKRFLLPRAEKAREVIPEEIKKSGGCIDVVSVYRISKAEGDVDKVKKLFQDRAIDIVTFTSSSTVMNFVELFKGDNITDLLKGCIAACIGPVTAKTAEVFGIKSHIIAREYTIEGLTNAILEYFSQPKKGVMREDYCGEV